MLLLQSSWSCPDSVNALVLLGMKLFLLDYCYWWQTLEKLIEISEEKFQELAIPHLAFLWVCIGLSILIIAFLLVGNEQVILSILSPSFGQRIVCDAKGN